MRNKHYKIYSFRLDEKTIKELKNKKGFESWNLFFLDLLNNYKKKNENRKE